MDFPELAARTRRFSHGAPRAVSVTGDGSRVVFLRSGGPEDPADALWALDTASAEERLVADPAVLLGDDADPVALAPGERALRERRRLSTAGIGSYALDGAGRVAVFALAGRLFRADLVHGDVIEVSTVGPVIDPRPDPTGQRVAYVTDTADGVRRGELRVVAPDGTDSLLAGEDGGVSWGLAEHVAAEEFGRFRGYWWAPDGRMVLAARVDESRLPRWHLHDPADPATPPTTVAYPRAGGPNAEVSLHLLDLDDGWVDVHWDRETYPYLASVDWADGNPLITVLRRSQQHGLVLAVDPRTGETQVHAELADPRWVEPIPGTPAHLPDGRVLVGGELAHDGYDARCLFADGTLLTPPSLYVRRVVGRLPTGPGPADLLVEASEGEPSQRHLYRVRTVIGGGVDARRMSSTPGWHTAAVGGDTLVVGTASLDEAGTSWSVWRGDREVARLRSLAATPSSAPRPMLVRVTDRRLPSAVLYPTEHVKGTRLPVLLDVYGGPGHQEVVAARSAWLERQWWADCGFAVVTIDNRGTPGVAPSFEKAIHRRVADVILTDQVDALTALAGKHPDLDLDRVAIRGWSFGGWLAGLAVLRHPELFRCGIAGAPVTDWTLYDTAYTERYLGLPDDGIDVYGHHSLVELAAEPLHPGEPARPLLLVHGMVDDNVVAAHTLRLSAALLSTGRPHAVLPLTGATHMAAGGLSERLLRLELDFLRTHLT
ncbi:prolyl oligopeptidase family serine peptidase [Micromonospora sp. RL09-050-HVF-A]|uniref:S9 family peptidase n=1 Tax=Micromonospora sp. RL09-050-HVF-A TaxID=1703433 RepID=UPI001C5DC9D1|nr:prolyl oligopeptidase family serine peptidase [Micromonospora sp. RL09-050-HVF-A]MBW4703115.1 prolyl oligopeptidase family serine peptidase [Micromonospora sp. RL09-050-HVF-A]